MATEKVNTFEDFLRQTDNSGIAYIWNKLNQRRELFIFGWAHWLLALVCIIALQMDERLLSGVNVWIKPLKFSLSIAIYGWTLAWLLSDLPKDWAKRMSQWTIATLAIEIVIITAQAALGKSSHFNMTTLWDIALFQIMGISILINTVILIKIARHYFKTPPAVNVVYLRGVRMAFISALAAVLPAIVMSVINNHSIGGPANAPGLPLLDWKTTVGDLRITHFLGLHGFQLFLILGILLSRISAKVSEKKTMQILNISFTLFMTMFFSFFVMALLGLSPFSWISI